MVYILLSTYSSLNSVSSCCRYFLAYAVTTSLQYLHSLTHRLGIDSNVMHVTVTRTNFEQDPERGDEAPGLSTTDRLASSDYIARFLMVLDSPARSSVAAPIAGALVGIGATLLFTSDLTPYTSYVPRPSWISFNLANDSSSDTLKSSDEGKKKGKTALESIVHVTYPTTLEMCDAGAPLVNTGAPQTIKTGALLKLIDVVAGVTARKHAGFSCVTISVDSVLRES